MLIFDLVGAVTQIQNKEIEAPVSKLGFTFISNTATPLTTTYTTFNAFQAALANMKITAVAQGKNRARTLLQDIPIGDLLEIAASNEGCVDADGFGIVQATIEFSERGALELDADTKLQVSVTGKPAGMNVYCYAIEHPNRVKEAILYETRTVNANDEKEFDVEDYHLIALPGTLSTLELAYANGNTARYKPEELAHIVKDVNEVVAKWAGFIQTGQSNFFVISIEPCTKVRVKFTAQSTIYLCREGVLDNNVKPSML